MAIYIGTHKKTLLPKSDWLVPIGLAGYKDDSVTISDSDGDRTIFKLNKNYCELTGLYWLYMNCQDPYIGYCHYRRFFTFEHYSSPAEKYPSFLSLDSNYNLMDYLSSKMQHANMVSLLDHYEVIVPRPVIQYESLAKEFKRAHGSEVWNVFISCCKEEFCEDVKYFDYEARFHYGNMFVMPVDIFKAYAKLLFKIIDKVYNIIGDLPEVPGARYQIYRYPGYLAERFLGFYIYRMRLRAFETPALWFK